MQVPSLGLLRLQAHVQTPEQVNLHTLSWAGEGAQLSLNGQLQHPSTPQRQAQLQARWIVRNTPAWRPLLQALAAKHVPAQRFPSFLQVHPQQLRGELQGNATLRGPLTAAITVQGHSQFSMLQTHPQAPFSARGHMLFRKASGEKAPFLWQIPHLWLSQGQAGRTPLWLKVQASINEQGHYAAQLLQAQVPSVAGLLQATRGSFSAALPSSTLAALMRLQGSLSATAQAEGSLHKAQLASFSGNLHSSALRWQHQGQALSSSPLHVQVSPQGLLQFARPLQVRWQAWQTNVEGAYPLRPQATALAEKSPLRFATSPFQLAWLGQQTNPQGQVLPNPYRSTLAYFGLTLPPLWSPQGHAQLQGQFTPQQGLHGQLTLANLGAYIPKTLAPLHQLNGRIHWQVRPKLQNNVAMALSLPKPLTAWLGKSPLRINTLQSTGLNGGLSPFKLVMEGQSHLHPRELNALIGNNVYHQPTQYPLSAPSHFTLQWQGKSPQQSRFSATVQAQALGHPWQQPLQVALLPQAAQEVAPPEAGDPVVRTHLQFAGPKLSQVQLQQGQFWLGRNRQPIHLQASLDAWTEASHFFSSRGRIWTPQPVELSQGYLGEASPFSAGELALDFGWTSAQGAPQGLLSLMGLKAPDKGLHTLGLSALSNGKALQLASHLSQREGQHLLLSGKVALPQAFPLLIENATMAGDRLSIDSLQALAGELSQGLTRTLNRGLPPAVQMLPSRQSTALPVELTQAQLDFKEVVLNNMLLQNVVGTLELFPNGYLELNPLSLKLAGGSVNGKLSLSPNQENTLITTLAVQDVQANALARMLLNAPNQVFGTLSGQLAFGTYGANQAQQIQHANGNLAIAMPNGRVPALSAVVRLLAVANLLRGGVLGVNWNTLQHIIAKDEALVYKAAMEGQCQILEGALYTKPFKCDGTDLDLDIRGNLRLDTGLSALHIKGSMNQELNDLTSRWGGASLKSLYRHVPLLGYWPWQRWGHVPNAQGVYGSGLGLIDYLPGLGYTPGLGGVAKPVNHFGVDLIGDPSSPSSVKNLRWLKY